MRSLGVAGQRAGVPEADRVIVAGGRELLAVGTERHVRDQAGVSVDRERLPAG